MSKKILMGTRPTKTLPPPAAADNWVENRSLDIEPEEISVSERESALKKEAGPEVAVLENEAEHEEAQPKKEKMKRLTFDVSESLHKLIKVACAERGTKIADELREILMEKYGTPPGEK